MCNKNAGVDSGLAQIQIKIEVKYVYSILFHGKKTGYKFVGVKTVGNSQHHHKNSKGACHCEVKCFPILIKLVHLVFMVLLS